MSGDLSLLISAAQTSLGGVPHQHDYRAKDILVRSARVQASCALALSVEHLALSLDRLADLITEGDGAA